jgi:hypothetical protein
MDEKKPRKKNPNSVPQRTSPMPRLGTRLTSGQTVGKYTGSGSNQHGSANRKLAPVQFPKSFGGQTRYQTMRHMLEAFASRVGDNGRTFLSAEPVPSLESIGRDPQFIAEEITREAFETVWAGSPAAVQP